MKSRKKSLLWSLFEPIDSHRAKCNDCKQKFSYRTSTSNLAKHLRRKHPSIIAAITSPSGSFQLPMTACTKTEEDYPENLEKPHEVFINDTTDGEELDCTVVNSGSSPTPPLLDHRSRDHMTEVKKDKTSRKSSESGYKFNNSTVYDGPITSISDKLSQNECETFGKMVASHLRELPVSVALECQSDILHHLVQKRLGRSSLDTRLDQYANDNTEQIIVQAWDNTD